MKLKALISLLTAACLLLVSFGPSFGRSTPYEPTKDIPTAHPWQDDDQYTEPDNNANFRIPFGPAVISFTVPAHWVKWLAPKSVNSQPRPEVTRSPKPLSLDQKGDAR